MNIANNHELETILAVLYILWLILTREDFFPAKRLWERVSLLAVILLAGFIAAVLCWHVLLFFVL